MYLTLEQVKKHLNIDNTFTADDEYINGLIAVSEAVVERHIGYKLNSLLETYTGALPAPILHAMLLLVGTMYANRESVTFGSAKELPLGYNYLLDLYTNLAYWG